MHLVVDLGARNLSHIEKLLTFTDTRIDQMSFELSIDFISKFEPKIQCALEFYREISIF